jgi:PilZ domain-containing protein
VTEPNGAERPSYPRLQAPAYFRPAGLPLFRRRPKDGDLGGVCVHTDEKVRPGSRMKLEVFLPNDTSVVCQVRVAWIERLPEGAPARYDVGLRLTAIDPRQRDLLGTALGHR